MAHRVGDELGDEETHRAAGALLQRARQPALELVAGDAGVSAPGRTVALNLALMPRPRLGVDQRQQGAIPVSSIVSRTSPSTGGSCAARRRCLRRLEQDADAVESMNVRPARSRRTGVPACARAASSRSAVARSSSPRSVRRRPPPGPSPP